MGYKRTTAPTAEPVTTAEAKTQARVSSSADDSYIDLLIQAAREVIEDYTGLALINQSWTLRMDALPRCSEFDLPINPVSSITSFSYVDTNGDTQVWSSSNYILDANRPVARLGLAYNTVWPTTRGQKNAISIVFVAGYGASGDDVPEVFKLAIKMLVAHWYLNRAEMGKIPESVENLIHRYKLEVA